ncbi:ABC transporter ATP-binding protein [Amphritea atlantica]|uniref:ABC transporter ATP-binding protein n=1 Tax=Amphritea atlantica TaxID=355243 RepID=A0ABY5GWV0_9GAMM|nr:ABC transporter ATP-binding protein [Amphritea atlantica]
MQEMKKTIIELDSVVFGWTEGQPVLNIPELSVASGERVFLKGPSGSGKSTLLNLIAGIHTPRQGSVRVLGEAVHHQGSAWRDNFRADHIGLIFQQFNLLPYLSVLDNVMLPCLFSKRRKARATERYGSLEEAATQLLKHLGMVSDALHGRGVTRLSIGQQQRVAAARALIGSPELIIADEPTSALDSDSRNGFLDLLIGECDLSGSTLVFVSHDSSLEAHFSQIISLRDINHAEELV